MEIQVESSVEGETNCSVMKYLLVTKMLFRKNYFYISMAYLFSQWSCSHWCLSEWEIRPSLTISSLNF